MLALPIERVMKDIGPPHRCESCKRRPRSGVQVFRVRDETVLICAYCLARAMVACLGVGVELQPVEGEEG